MPAPHLALVLAAIFWGALARAFTGFGAVLFALPLLALVLPVREAVPLLVSVGLVNGLWLSWRGRRDASVTECRRLLLGGVPGALAGLLLARNAPDHVLRGLLGLLVALAGVWVARRSEGPEREWLPGWGYGAGVAGGVLGGLYGLSGPAPVLYLSGRTLTPAVFRATLLLYITALDLVLATGFAVGKSLGPHTAALGLALLPVALAGSWLGERLHRRAPEVVFRRLTGFGLTVMGLVLAVRAYLDANLPGN